MWLFLKVCQNNIVVVLAVNLVVYISRFVDVECRQVTQPVEDVQDILKRLNNTNVAAVDSAGPPCLLDIQQDLPKSNAPLYIVPDTNKFWLPNVRGQLQVPRGAAIELYCSKPFANATAYNNATSSNNTGPINISNTFKIASSRETLRPLCLHDKTFVWQGEKYELQQLLCEQPPWYTVEQLQAKCPAMTDDRNAVHAQMYRVGFNISGSGSGSRFMETMRICYDVTMLRTLYVQHTLLPVSVHFQKYIKHSKFSKAGHFNGVNMNHLYSKKSQRQQAGALLQGQHEHLFDNSTLFLARGHLAAKADFIYGNQQRATFNFFNVAPQWQSFNAGQWVALEHEVRKFVASSKLSVDCYTGTFGIQQLPYKIVADGGDSDDSNATQYRNFYLLTDSNNNNNSLLPVPRLFYRLIIDRTHNSTRGIALVGVNNPHATKNEINASDIICDDVHNQVAWLQWMKNKDFKKGFMYACRVSEFVAAVGHLPKSLCNVTELLT